MPTPHAFTELGGQPRPVDGRDIQLGAVQAPVSIPASYNQTQAWSLPIEYQGQQPACGAHAGTFLKEILDAYYTPGHYSPRFTWADIKTFDGFPIDAGTDMRSIFKSVKGTGTLDFPLLGNDATLDLNTYAHPTITAAMKQNAAGKVINTYGFVSDMTFQGLKQAIYQNKAVLLLIQVGTEFWTAPDGTVSWAEKDILPLRYPKSIVSGHFVVAHSYDENYIYFENHWSTAWGRNGHGYFGENYMPRVLEAGTAVELAFAKDLSFGLSDPDVKRLQVKLNQNPATQVAASGVGSPGQETVYFGSLTQAAVKKYQALHNIPTTGYVGALTRAALSAL